MSIARTDATGGGLLPEVLEFETSLPIDKRLYRADILGSIAHVIMLARRGIVPAADAETIRTALLAILADADAGKLVWANEEDVHMAIESELARRIGEPAGRLHTARSRNDQITLDERLYVRERVGAHLETLSSLIEALCDRAASDEGRILLPAYTHRQRAQPVRAAYYFCAWAAMLARDLDAFRFVLSQADASSLGVGAISGTSLPTDRDIVRGLLGFGRLTVNGMDTVGDRDFVLDFVYATTRAMLHVSRIATDVVDFSTDEFGFVALDGSIACGSSMMPQKKNPDVFELLRGKSAGALGDLVALATLIKGMPTGYMRDLQEDKLPLFSADERLALCLKTLKTGFEGIRLRPERTLAGIEEGFTQATDLAERLVARGVPFREAYKAVGALVRLCVDADRPLASITLDEARRYAAAFEQEDLRVLDPAHAADAKQSAGGTGAGPLQIQIEQLRAAAKAGHETAAVVPTVDRLLSKLASAPLAEATQ